MWVIALSGWLKLALKLIKGATSLQKWLIIQKSSSVESRVGLGRRRFRQASSDAQNVYQKAS
jgi:hypothetical protein